MVPVQLHASFTISRLKPQTFPRSRRFRLSSRPRPAMSSNSANGAVRPIKNGVVTNGTAPIRYPDGESVQLPPELHSELMPSHVAMIMDGNRRWAQVKGLPIGSGYEAGVRSLRRAVELCRRWGIRVLSVFAFSSDNWFRPKVETDLLMGLFERVLKDEIQRFMRENIRLSLLGNSSKLPKPLQVLLDEAVKTTERNSGLHLILAINYSGHADIVQACQKLAHKVKDGRIEPNDISELLVERELQTYCTDYPYPDLLIRTSGELRISNFLLWQIAYTELYFSHSLWPDFGEDEFLEALCDFQRRQRRYGGQNS